MLPITGRQENYVTVKLPSNEVRLINNLCLSTVGQIIILIIETLY